MRKRLLSLLLVLACVLTLAVVPVVAAEPDPVQPTASVTEPTPTTDPEPSSEPSPEPSPAPSPVPTPSGPWYQAALDFARDHRILLGDPSGNMMPNDNATRAQMAAMLVRVFGCTAGKDIAHLTDVSTTAWYYSELSTAAQMNIFNGYGDGTMGPNRSITRQEAMIVIARAFAVPAWSTAITAACTPRPASPVPRSRRCSITSACSFAPMPLRSRPPAASFIPAPRP